MLIYYTDLSIIWYQEDSTRIKNTYITFRCTCWFETVPRQSLYVPIIWRRKQIPASTKILFVDGHLQWEKIIHKGCNFPRRSWTRRERSFLQIHRSSQQVNSLFSSFYKDGALLNPNRYANIWCYFGDPHKGQLEGPSQTNHKSQIMHPWENHIRHFPVISWKRMICFICKLFYTLGRVPNIWKTKRIGFSKGLVNGFHS